MSNRDRDMPHRLSRLFIFQIKAKFVQVRLIMHVHPSLDDGAFSSIQVQPSEEGFEKHWWVPRRPFLLSRPCVFIVCLLTCSHLYNDWMSEMVTHCGTESIHLLLVTCLINNATWTVFTQQALLLQYASLALLFTSGYFIFYLTLYYLSS